MNPSDLRNEYLGWVARRDQFQRVRTEEDVTEIHERLRSLNHADILGIRIYHPHDREMGEHGILAVVDLSLTRYSLPLTWAQILLTGLDEFRGNRHHFVDKLTLRLKEPLMEAHLDDEHSFVCREFYWRCGP